MNQTKPYSVVALLASLVLISGLASMLIWALWALPPESLGLSGQVTEHLPKSGVTAEVTAILLNFRGYDTLLEVAVLLAALLGVWCLGSLPIAENNTNPGPIMATLVRFLVPLMVLISGYVLWLGGHAAGGAFQAGALLAGAGVLLRVVWPDKIALRNSLILRALLIAGPAIFALVAAAMLFTGGALLQYPIAAAGSLILLIEAASTVSIGLTLLLLFAGGRPGNRGNKQ